MRTARSRLPRASLLALLALPLALAACPSAHGGEQTKLNKEASRPPSPADELRDIMAIEEAEARATALLGMREKFVDGSPPYNMLSAMTVQAWSEVPDYDKMVAAASEVSAGDNPIFASVQNTVAYTFAEANIRLDEARFRVEQALDILKVIESKGEVEGEMSADAIQSSRAAFLDTLAWVLYRQGELEEAETQMRAAIDLSPNAVLLYHLGAILEAKGDSEGAKNAYEATVELGAQAEDPDKEVQLAREGIERLQAGAAP